MVLFDIFGENPGSVEQSINFPWTTNDHAISWLIVMLCVIVGIGGLDASRDDLPTILHNCNLTPSCGEDKTHSLGSFNSAASIAKLETAAIGIYTIIIHV